MTPPPSTKKPPRTLAFEWGLDTGTSRLQTYLVTANQVTHWSLDGEWDKHAVIEFALPKTRSGIVYHRVLVGGRVGKPLLHASWMLAIGTTGHYLSLSRGTCSDEQWARVLRIPEHFGPSTILSGSVRCTSETWLATWVPQLTET